MPRRIGTDESAVTSLPFRLTVSGVLFVVILLLSSVYLFDFLEEAKEKTALDEVSKLTAAAEQLSLHGEGSEISLELRLPEGVSVDFGALPGGKTNGLRMRMITASVQQKKVTFYYSAASFSNPELNGAVSLASGRHRLLLSTKTRTKIRKIIRTYFQKKAFKKSDTQEDLRGILLRMTRHGRFSSQRRHSFLQALFCLQELSVQALKSLS